MNLGRYNKAVVSMIIGINFGRVRVAEGTGLGSIRYRRASDAARFDRHRFHVAPSRASSARRVWTSCSAFWVTARLVSTVARNL